MPPLFSAFVGHLAKETTREELINLFSRCGPVKDVYIHCDDDRPYGYGFVRFPDMQHVLKAVTNLNRWPLHGKEIKVDVASECKDYVPLACKSRKPSRTEAMRDGILRGQVREACIEVNEDLELGSGEVTALDSKHVLDSMAFQRNGLTSKLTGMPSSDAVATLDHMRGKLWTGDYSLAIPPDHKPHHRASTFFYGLRTISDNINEFLKVQVDMIIPRAVAHDGPQALMIDATEDSSTVNGNSQQKTTSKMTPDGMRNDCTGAYAVRMESPPKLKACHTNEEEDHRGVRFMHETSLGKSQDTMNEQAAAITHSLFSAVLSQACASGSKHKMHPENGYKNGLLRPKQAYDDHDNVQCMTPVAHSFRSGPLSQSDSQIPLQPPRQPQLCKSQGKPRGGLLPDPVSPPSLYGAFPSMGVRVGHMDHLQYKQRRSPQKQNTNHSYRQKPGLSPMPECEPSSKPTPWNGSVPAQTMKDDSGSRAKSAAVGDVHASSSDNTDANRVDSKRPEENSNSSITIPEKLRHIFESQTSSSSVEENHQEYLSIMRELGRHNSNILFTCSDNQLKESCDPISSDSGIESFEDPYSGGSARKDGKDHFLPPQSHFKHPACSREVCVEKEEANEAVKPSGVASVKEVNPNSLIGMGRAEKLKSLALEKKAAAKGFGRGRCLSQLLAQSNQC